MIEIVDDVDLQARLQPQRLAIHDLKTEKRWNYAQWNEVIFRLAGVLQHCYGITEGNRIAALGRNCPEYAMLHMAAARIGAIFVPLNWRLAPPEISALLEDCTPSMLVYDHEFFSSLNHNVKSCLPFTELRELILEAEPLTSTPLDPDRISLILYTSGTTGRPKGVLLSERNIGQTALNFGIMAQVTHESVTLLETPMFHVLGIITNLRPGYQRGAAILLSEGFDPERSLERLYNRSLGITHYFCVPQMAQMLRAAKNFDAKLLKNLTGIFSGGAPHPSADIRAWLQDNIPIADGFGMSEAGTVTCMPLNVSLIDEKAGAAGLVPPGIRCRIVDPKGIDVPSGASGELLLKGDNIFQGYWQRPLETAASFTDDGWFKTGDIARQDKDGFIFFVDRKKDMFISGGENVYPVEIEAALAKLPGIKECAVIGVADTRWGEVGHLAVVVSYNGPNETSIRDHLNVCLARYKIPKYISFVEVLPRSGSGKIQRSKLKAELYPDNAETD